MATTSPSDNNSFPHFQIPNDNYEFTIEGYYDRRLPTAVMLALFAVLGLQGNLLVVLVNLKEKKMTNTNLLIFIMAIVDFLGALTASLFVIHITNWFNILDIRFCKLVLMLTYTVNTPAIYLTFGVSVIRYYSVCKPQMLFSIHKKIKPFCICVLIITLVVAVIFCVCAVRTPWPNAELPGFFCDIETKENLCGFATGISLLFIILSYIFCLVGLIVLNVRILKRMYQQRKVMLRYKNVPMNRLSRTKIETINVRKRSKPESVAAETTESPLTSVHDLSDILDDTFKTKDSSTQDSSSDKGKSSNSPDNSLATEEKTENILEQQPPHPRRKTLKRKSKRKSIKIHIEVEKIDLRQNVTEGDSPKSEIIQRKSFPNKITNDGSVNEEEADNYLDKSCYGKCCLQRLLFKFEGFNRTTLKLSFVSIAYIGIYLPWFVLQIVRLSEPIYEHQSPLLHTYIVFPVDMLPFAGCAVNPVVYAFVDPKFRSQCRALFK